MTDVFKPSKQSCEVKTFDKNAVAKNMGGAIATAAMTIFIAPTITPKDIWAGLFLLMVFGALALLASYGLNYGCARRNGGVEFIIAFTTAFVFSMLMAYIYLGVPLETLFSVNVLETEVVLGTSVGGFFGSILK